MHTFVGYILEECAQPARSGLAWFCLSTFNIRYYLIFAVLIHIIIGCIPIRMRLKTESEVISHFHGTFAAYFYHSGKH